MIKSIYIKNFAIIDEFSIHFKNGLNIITGETGSGKTLIIKAIQCLLGKRFSSEMLGPHGNKIIIEGEFENKGDVCIIRRIFDSSGGSRSFLDDEPVKQKDLILKTREMVDLHGQHEHQRLLNADSHMTYLDLFMPDNSLMMDIKNYHDNITELRKQLSEMEMEQEKSIENQELHDLQHNELSQLPLSIEYYVEINKKHDLINGSIEIKELSLMARRLLEGDSSSIMEKSIQLIKILNSICKYDDNFNEYISLIDSKIIDLQDLSNKLNELNSAASIDENESDEINDKFMHLQMLKRKYGGTIESVIDYRDELINKCKQKDDYVSRIVELEKRIKELKIKYLKNCKILSMKRNKHAKTLEENINGTLKELAMVNSNFNIILKFNKESFTINGMDECRFYFSTNIGHEPVPLDKIASGGEISRIMLAIKMAIQEKDLVSSLVFDEIDSGISGRIAEKVGLSMEELSVSQQVICITHLSQIASKGKYHIKIYKCEVDDMVVVKVKSLNDKDRINEIASLISGEMITESGYDQAKILLADG